jgi:hypothetical protein
MQPVFPDGGAALLDRGADYMQFAHASAGAKPIWNY